MTNPPLKYHGGKHYLAPMIIALMPRHRSYVEPFAGGLQVLLRRDPHDEALLWPGETGVSELVNDLDGDLTNFWRVLQTDGHFERFRRIVEAVPFSEWEWVGASERLTHDDPVERAVGFFVRCRMSLAGRMDSFTGFTKSRLRGGMNAEANAWINAVEGLSAAHHRLRRVVILNEDAIRVIRRFDREDVLVYADPPYLPSTRESPEVYRHEMTAEQHEQLLGAIRTVRAKVMISGNPSELYDDVLADWGRHTIVVADNSSGAKEKRRRQEVVWCNFRVRA